jgi:outer membrane protein, multidrug efflux system
MFCRIRPAFRGLSSRGLTSCVVSVLAMSVGGCMVGPNFRAPQTPVPKDWIGTSTAPATQPSEAQVDITRWWAAFHDPTLDSLMQRALESNLDLRQAVARIRQARATRGVAVSAFWPTVNLGTGFSRSFGGGSGATAHSLFQTGLDASWELDVFGGIRRNIEAADANLQAAVENRRDVLVTLAAEVGLDYVSLRGFQQQIAIAQENLQAQQHTADLTRQRFNGGFASALDVANADAQVATTASVIPPLETSEMQTIYSLSVLLDREPGALLAELTPMAGIPTSTPEVPMGLPSDLLRRRPDIRQAEAQIHAATAQIGVATANLYPQFSLTGSAGFHSAQLENFLNSASRTWSIGPSATWTLFDAGGIRSNIQVQQALQEQSLLTYRQTVLTALQDVENALVAYFPATRASVGRGGQPHAGGPLDETLYPGPDRFPQRAQWTSVGTCGRWAISDPSIRQISPVGI